jgi:hypothetical protein
MEREQGIGRGSFGTPADRGVTSHLAGQENNLADAARDVADKAKDAAGQVGERAKDGWEWVRQNPWPVLGAAIGVGLLAAWRRRTDARRRIAHMDADHPVGHTRKIHIGGTDEVAEKMSEASSH